MWGSAVAQVQTAEHREPQAAAGIKLGECTVYAHAESGTFIAIHGGQHFFGTAEHAMPFTRGRCTQYTARGLTVQYSAATREGKQGLLLCCTGSNRFYEAVDESSWTHFPNGPETMVTVCHGPSSGHCEQIDLPCGTTVALRTGSAVVRTNGTAPATNGSPPPAERQTPSRIVQAAAAMPAAATAAPAVTLIENERVRPEEAMVFTRSVLLEEGPAVASMRQYQENIDTVRHNMNSYRIGYALPAQKIGDRYVFVGAVKGWRATSTGDSSAWPPFTYPVSRNEARRRAQQLKAIAVAEPLDEINNLRVYHYPIMVGYQGRQYQVDPTAIAFFIHPKTGHRMTVMYRGGRAYGAVNGPLACTSKIYIQDVKEYPAGPLGLGAARVPSVFYSKGVTFDVQPFAEDDNLQKLMATMLAAHTSGPLSTDDFQALYNEMARYTGGAVEMAAAEQ
jgi:hypothetical protein